MKIIRAFGIAFALLTPAFAFATPKLDSVLVRDLRAAAGEVDLDLGDSPNGS